MECVFYPFLRQCVGNNVLKFILNDYNKNEANKTNDSGMDEVAPEIIAFKAVLGDVNVRVF